MKKNLISLLLAFLAITAFAGGKKDVPFQLYREIEAPGVTMEQIVNAVMQMKYDSHYDYHFMIDTIDFEGRYCNLEGCCDIDFNPKGYWTQSCPVGEIYSLVKVTARDGIIKLWLDRCSYGSAMPLWHDDYPTDEYAGLYYTKIPSKIRFPLTRLAMRPFYKSVRKHFEQWADWAIQHIADMAQNELTVIPKKQLPETE